MGQTYQSFEEGQQVYRRTIPRQQAHKPFHVNTQSTQVCRVYDIEAGADEPSGLCPVLAIRNHNAISPEILGHAQAQRLNSKVFKVHSLEILGQLGVARLVHSCAKRIALEGLA